MRQQLIWVFHHNSLGKLGTIQLLLKSARLPKDSSVEFNSVPGTLRHVHSFQKPVSENSKYSYLSYFQAHALSFLPHVASR